MMCNLNPPENHLISQASFRYARSECWGPKLVLWPRSFARRQSERHLGSNAAFSNSDSQSGWLGVSHGRVAGFVHRGLPQTSHYSLNPTTSIICSLVLSKNIFQLRTSWMPKHMACQILTSSWKPVPSRTLALVPYMLACARQIALWNVVEQRSYFGLLHVQFKS